MRISYFLPVICLLAILSPLSAALATQTCRTLDLSQSAPVDRYILEAGGTVTDKVTGLTWKRCSEGQSGEHCEKGKAAAYSWREALAPADSAQGWRLPTVDELGTLLEYQCTMPAINLTVFPATPPVNFWSATPYAGYLNGSWNINFNDGVRDNSSRNYRLYVRLVRSSVSGGKQ